MSTREISPATSALQLNWNNFVTEFETELRRQSTKHNASSERRMRKLLRSFNSLVYVPYRDATLDSRQDIPF